MIIKVFFVFIFFITLYCGLFRIIDYKKKEFLQFIMIYAALLAIMACIIFLAEENVYEYWYPHFDPLKKQLFMALFYVPPTFGIAYLLYPFKIIKRNKTLLWILLNYTLICILIYVLLYTWPFLLDIALSNM